MAESSQSPQPSPSRGRGRGHTPRGKPPRDQPSPRDAPRGGSFTARGAANNRPVPNFLDLDCFAPAPGQTWPPPDEFGVTSRGPPMAPWFGAPPPPPWMGRGGGPPHMMRGHPPRGQRGGWRGGPNRGRGRKRPNNNNNGPYEKKIREEDDGEEFKFWCDPCSRGFKDSYGWNGHKATHTTCGIDGCRYFAAGKLVKLHQDLQHKTGLAKKIWSLESKENIDKWRDERKKNFPTKSRVEEKRADMAGRLERGELLETKTFDKFRRGRGRGRGRGRDRDRTDYSYRDRRPARGRGGAQQRGRGNHGNGSAVAPSNETVSREKGDKEVTGDPLAFFNADSIDDNDADQEEKPAEEPAKKPSGIGGALGALMCQYSDSDSDVSETEETIVAPRSGQVHWGRTAWWRSVAPASPVAPTFAPSAVFDRFQRVG